MTVHHATPGHQPKSLKEGAVCFGCAAVMLLAAALAAQWLLNLLT